MKTVTCTIQIVDGRVWASMSTCGEPGTATVHQLLRWTLEQLNFGNCAAACDERGHITSMTFGAAVAPPLDSTTLEAVQQRVQDRVAAVSIAGVFAKAREEGVEQEHSALADRARDTAQKGTHDNTELYYALELEEILARIRDVSFVFEAPPIKSKAAPAIVALLREATRAYLFNLRRSSVSLCRALLEAALRDQVPEAELREERRKTEKGELECLIDIAARNGVLLSQLATQSHNVRKAGNKALHGSEPSDAVAWAVLLDVRAVVSAVYS